MIVARVLGYPFHRSFVQLLCLEYLLWCGALRCVFCCNNSRTVDCRVIAAHALYILLICLGLAQ